jgi:hypothetical protein
LSLSEHATAENIIDKLDGVYGNVYSSEALLENFFKETQQPNQSVAEYGMKLDYHLVYVCFRHTIIQFILI